MVRQRLRCLTVRTGLGPGLEVVTAAANTADAQNRVEGAYDVLLRPDGVARSAGASNDGSPATKRCFVDSECGQYGDSDIARYAGRFRLPVRSVRATGNDALHQCHS